MLTKIVTVIFAIGVLQASGINSNSKNTDARVSGLRSYTECGGVIPITAMYYTLISHFDGATSPDQVVCTWVLIPEGNITSVKLDVTWNPAFVGSGLLAYIWDDTGLTKVELPKGNFEWTFDQVPTILTFSHAPGENGFTANFSSIGTYGLSRARGYHFAKNDGSFSYPIQPDERYRDNERVIIVINMVLPRPAIMGSKEVFLKIIDLEDELDFVDVYSLFFNVDIIQHGYVGR